MRITHSTSKLTPAPQTHTYVGPALPTAQPLYLSTNLAPQAVGHTWVRLGPCPTRANCQSRWSTPVTSPFLLPLLRIFLLDSGAGLVRLGSRSQPCTTVHPKLVAGLCWVVGCACLPKNIHFSRKDLNSGPGWYQGKKPELGPLQDPAVCGHAVQSSASVLSATHTQH